MPQGDSARSADRRDADRAGDGAQPRDAVARLADHAAIERLASDLLPALVARLSGTGLGELEVREGEWRVRLRRPATSGHALERSAERPGRSQRAGREAGRDGRDSRDPGREPGREAGRAAGGQPASPSSTGAHDDSHRHAPLVATSPAVGVFRARSDLRSGTRVRAGERLGVVDLLGVPQEVTAVGEAVVAALFVEDGDAVEYGQPLLALEPVQSPEHEAAPQAVPVG
ncbi:MAG TPA: hypothetical protein VEY67_00885 [Candidatus Dormibacteraeota bacterium]|nr:hypothetical protein [Candidatus Dormibacteraeota bacterium]